MQHSHLQWRVVYIQEEFEAYLKCGVLNNGFLRVSCQDCHRERLVAFSCKRRGFCPSCGAKRMIESSAHLVDNVLPNQPVRQWVLSFPYQLRFLLASNPAIMTSVLQIVYRAIATYIIKKAGLSRKRAHTGAVTFIQRFGSALNLNIHFHMLFLDGAYLDTLQKNGDLKFVQIDTIASQDFIELTHKISLRVAGYLERNGFISRDAENCYLNDDMFASDELLEKLGSSINYRIAIGPHKGKKVFTLKTLPPDTTDTKDALGNVGGFSLHADVSIKANRRDQLERLCRYISRPAISKERIALTEEGNIIYELKNPYHNGTTHVIYDPLDFISKLVALIPITFSFL